MRKIFVIIVLVLSLVVTCYAQEPAGQTKLTDEQWVMRQQNTPLDYFFQEYKKLLRGPMPTEELSKAAKLVLAEVEVEENKFKEVFNWARDNKVRLDFIGNLHSPPNFAKDIYYNTLLFRQVRQSQDLVISLLQKGRYRCVGREVHFREFGVIKNFEDVKRWEEKLGIQDNDVLSGSEMILLYRKADWLARFKWKSKTLIVPAEIKALNEFNIMAAVLANPDVAKIFELDESPPTLTLDQTKLVQKLLIMTIICRTKFAMHETLRYMQLHNLKRGAVVFGASHGYDFAVTAKDFGIISTVKMALLK